eukprot:jgi/Mesvir1/23395/Mv21090-RA.1
MGLNPTREVDPERVKLLEERLILRDQLRSAIATLDYDTALRARREEQLRRDAALFEIILIKRSLYIPPSWSACYVRHPIECYKAVALVGTRMMSVYDGKTEYNLGETVRAARGGGGWAPIECCFFVHQTRQQALNAVFPKGSAHAGAPQVILTVRVRGRGYIFHNRQKMAFAEITPTNISVQPTFKAFGKAMRSLRERQARELAADMGT